MVPMESVNLSLGMPTQIGRMTRLGMARLLKVAVVLAATACMLLSAIHVSTDHNPVALAQVEAQRHAELAIEVAEHGHSHFDGEEAERSPGHLHGHNSADHVHDAANVLIVPDLRLPAPTRVALPTPQDGPAGGLRHGLDRPPRPTVA